MIPNLIKAREMVEVIEVKVVFVFIMSLIIAAPQILAKLITLNRFDSFHQWMC